MLPRFRIVHRHRPVALVAPGFVSLDADLTSGVPHQELQPLPQPAPYVAVEAEVGVGGPGVLALRLAGPGRIALNGRYDVRRSRLGLSVTDATGRTTYHRSRRHGRLNGRPRAVALTLTGTWLTVWADLGDGWSARGRVHLQDRIDVRDEDFCAELRVGHAWSGAGPAPVTRLRAGGFGQLGLRDLRLVTTPDGEPWRPEGRLHFTATSAGPGFFATGHTSVWSLDETTLEVEHRADLFFRRHDRPGVFGDHSTHLLRDGDRWLVPTSTWGDFERARSGATVGATLAETQADLLRGRHVLDTRPLALPTDGLRSVGVWDPHLARDGDAWLVGFVSAPRFFRFHPALATGPDLGRLSLRGAARDRVATEGTTLVRIDGQWRLLASDGRDGRPAQRERFPVFDLDLAEIGALAAPYPTNLPWPSLARSGDGWLMLSFNGRGYGGPLPGYGTHGDIVVMRAP